MISKKKNGYRLTVDRSSSKRCVSIQIRLAVGNIFLRVSNLIGKGLSCRESTCRIEAGLTRFYLCKNFFYIEIKEKLLLVKRDIC